jgi:hypothetical protein
MDNEFNLERAIAGDPIETVAGTPVEFVTYRPNVKESKQLIVEVGTDLCTYYANGRYHGNSTGQTFPYDLRMKPNLKQIDWAKLPVDTLLTLSLCTGKDIRYFNSFSNGVVLYYRNGWTSKIATTKDVIAINQSNVQIASDQPWIVWQGGGCPLPDGLEFEYMIHDDPSQVIVSKESVSAYLYLWCTNLIYAYRLTGKVLDGWTL